MSSEFSQSEIEHLLYTNEYGEPADLDEVQLLDPPPQDRIPALWCLLEKQDIYIVFQTAIVLAAWGDLKGLAKIEEMIDQRVDRLEGISSHRLYGYDNVYDELAYATYLFGLSGQGLQDRKRIFGKLLSLYGSNMFESKLKYALLKSDFSELAPEVKKAIERSMLQGHDYLASQLLPVLARWNPIEAWDMVKNFLNKPQLIPDPVANVAQTLGYIDTLESQDILEQLTNYPDRAVAEEAQRSLGRLSSGTSD